MSERVTSTPVLRSLRVLVVLAATALVAVALAMSAPAAADADIEFTVDSPDDAPFEDGVTDCTDDTLPCTLRAAVQQANDQDPGNHVRIHLPADGAVYDLDHADGALEVDSAIAQLTIEGEGSSDDPDTSSIIDAGGTGGLEDRILTITSDEVDVALVNVRLQGGRAIGDDEDGDGGAVFFDSAGQLEVRDSVVRDNRADGHGGAVWTDIGAVTIEGDSTVEDNSAELQGGAVRSTGHAEDEPGAVTIRGATLQGNESVQSSGGAVRTTDATVRVLHGATVHDNQAQFHGGGVQTRAGAVEVDDSIFTENTAGSDGGAIQTSRSSSGGTVTITGGSTLADNVAGSTGGAVYNNLSDCTVDDGSVLAGNVAGRHGGAMYCGRGQVIIDGSTFVDNEAEDQGGAVRVSDGDLVVRGGAQLIDNASTDGSGGAIAGSAAHAPGTITISRSTIEGNEAHGDGGAVWSVDNEVLLDRATIADNVAAGNGGAVAVEAGTVTVTTTTLTANAADDGGGVYVSADAEVSLEYATLADNIAGGDGAQVANEGSVTAVGTILADDEGAACAGSTLTSEGHNLSSDDSCGLDAAQDDLIGVDPLLGPLADNGGLTLTVALDPDSPARDAGGVDCEDTDQRGVERPQGAACDIGAFELPPLMACPPGEVPAAGFIDVPADSVHAGSIDCLAWYDIARGRTDTTFVPGAPVTRAQQASFVARMLEAAGLELPDVSDDAFDDIAGSTHAQAISQLAELGVVEGRGDGVFAPSGNVTRAQSASMIVRAANQVLDEPLPAPPGPFVDTAGSVHEANIDAAAAAEITQGRTATTFDPGADTRRDQMASLLARTLEVLAQHGHITHP